MCVSLENGLAHIREENRAQLEQMRLTVDEKLNATVDQRLEDSFAAVTRRLEQVTESLNAMKTLAGTVDELGKIIGGAQPLGMVGEAQLGTLLSQMALRRSSMRSTPACAGRRTGGGLRGCHAGAGTRAYRLSAHRREPASAGIPGTVHGACLRHPGSRWTVRVVCLNPPCACMPGACRKS